jgi:hypothetical protein
MRAYTDDGAWCWFQDPRAIEHDGRTCAAWVAAGGDIVVGTEAETVVLHDGFEKDDHDAPALWTDPDGHLVAFYTAHGGPEVCWRRETDPGSLEFGPERSVDPRRDRGGDPGYTYPNPRLLGDDLYLFYRTGNGSLSYVVADPRLLEFGTETELVTTDGRDWCVYFKISDVRDGAVEIGMTYAEGGRHEPHRDLRHAAFDGETLRTAGGDRAGGRATFWDLPVVYDSDATGNDAWVWDCAATAAGAAVVYAELVAEDDHRYRYARYDGDAWTDEELADAGSHIVAGDGETYYSGGVYLDHADPDVVYCSVGDHDGSTLERLERGDAWDRETVASGEQNVRPVVARGGGNVLWMRGRYDHFADEDYATRIVGP